jgi:hypothetical protein
VVAASLAFISLTVTAAPAAAAIDPGVTQTYPAIYTESGGPPDPILTDLSVNLTANETRYIFSRVQLDQASTRIYVRQMIECLNSSGSVVNGSARTWQNILPGQTLVLTSRQLFTAPVAGTYRCRTRFKAYIPGGAADDRQRVRVVGNPGTYLSVDDNPEPFAAQSFQAADVKIAVGSSADVAVLNWTAPAGVTTFVATADTELTNCYSGGPPPCTTSPSNTLSSVVDSRLQVMQRNDSGGYCKITNWPSSGYDRTTITRDEHHEKNYHRVTASLSNASGCTRNFRIKVFARTVSGNPVNVDNAGFTNTFVMD